jgi:hypothetical protein
VNPFQQAFTRMYFPPDKAPVVSVRGFVLAAEGNDRSVQVPDNLVEELKPHGLSITPFEEVETKSDLKIPTMAGKK